jgi:hypothetical protein
MIATPWVLLGSHKRLEKGKVSYVQPLNGAAVIDGSNKSRRYRFFPGTGADEPTI